MIEKWRVTCYYGREVEWPKVPGEVAIQAVHTDECRATWRLPQRSVGPTAPHHREARQ